MPEQLQWDHDGETWEAASCAHHGDDPFHWRITVDGDDGRFDIANSDAELRGDRKPRFDTFGAAKSWCQGREESLAADEATQCQLVSKLRKCVLMDAETARQSADEIVRLRQKLIVLQRVLSAP